MVAGVASAHSGPLAVAQAAAGWDQDVLAGHGCRVSPQTGLRVPPSASMLDRLPRLLDADEFEAALSASVAAAALDPAIPAACAAHRREEQRRQAEKQKKRKRKPPAAGSFRGERGDGWFRAHPSHPWLDPAVTADPGHVPARRAVAVDGKERKLAKAGGSGKCTCSPRSPTSPAWSSARTRSPRPARRTRSRTSGRCWSPCPSTAS